MYLKKGKITKEQLADNKRLDELLRKVNSNLKLDKPSTAVLLPFEGQNNILKRKTLYTNFNADTDYKIEFAVPHNCYVLGVIIRKVLHFYGSNTDEQGSVFEFKDAKLTISEMLKPRELEVTVGYDSDFECDVNPSGLYLNYMDECNLEIKNNEGVKERVFGGYVSTPLPTSDRKTITIHCADRLKDGENKFILEQLFIQHGDKAPEESEYPENVSFQTYPQALNYLCQCYECTLTPNINKKGELDKNDTIEYKSGFSKKFGKKKDIKKIKVSNGQVTVNKNSIMLRNNSSGKKKQVFTLYNAKNPIDITGDEKNGYYNLHITYGLGDVKTEYEKKDISKVDVSDTVAGAQKFSKCGVSKDKKYVMGIGRNTAGAQSSTYPYKNIYRSVFVNKCPMCGKTGVLQWDCYKATVDGTEISCICGADFDCVTGYEKDGTLRSKLDKVGKTVKSSKSEQKKLKSGEMVATADGNAPIKPEDIFKAIKNSCKGFTYATGCSKASCLENTGKGDCFAWSDKISKELTKYKVNNKIVEYPTAEAPSGHRSVLYQNSKGKYVDFPYREYNFPKLVRNTDGSKNPSKIIKHYKAGGRITQATATGSTTKTQTTTVKITEGYDKDKPFQAYLDIIYSTTKTGKKYHVYVDFTQKANSSLTLSGLTLVWVNNAVKTISLNDFSKQLLARHKGANKIYLHSMSFVAPVIKSETDSSGNKTSTDWYTNDKSTHDNSSCKILLYGIKFDNEAGADPSDLMATGKPVNETIKKIVEDADYTVDMEYGRHRVYDKIIFKSDRKEEPVFHATEGDSNNILEWGNLTFDPANTLHNKSICVFKDNAKGEKLYSYVGNNYLDSILKYHEQCTLITESESIGAKEAAWKCNHNEEFNPEQTYSCTITVKGLPKLSLKDLVQLTADFKKLNTLKEVDSIIVNYSFDEKPTIRTELGLGELAPDLQVKKIIKGMRDDAKKDTTYFPLTATPVLDEDIYEWEN